MAFTALPASQPIERYFGGGKLFLTPIVKGVEGDEYEVGEIKDFKLKIESETKTAMSHDGGRVKEVEEVVVNIKGSGSFSTQNNNVTNRALSMFGTATTQTFAAGDILPDGTTAAADTTINKIQAGQTGIIEVKVRFIGAQSTGAKKPVAIIHKASITADGDINYMSEDYEGLGFSLKVLETADGFYDEYMMDVA